MGLEVGQSRDFDAFEGAFFLKDLEKPGRLRPRVGIAVEIDDVIEVARPGALGERPELLREGLEVIVGPDLDPVPRCVRIRMEYLSSDRGQNDNLVRRQIEFYARQCVR